MGGVVYQIDPTTLAPPAVSSFALSAGVFPFGEQQFLPLAAGDTQGPGLRPLITRFTIDDGLNPPVEVATEQRWQCTGRAPEVWRALRIR